MTDETAATSAGYLGGTSGASFISLGQSLASGIGSILDAQQARKVAWDNSYNTTLEAQTRKQQL